MEGLARSGARTFGLCGECVLEIKKDLNIATPLLATGAAHESLRVLATKSTL